MAGRAAERPPPRPENLLLSVYALISMFTWIRLLLNSRRQSLLPSMPARIPPRTPVKAVHRLPCTIWGR